MAAPRLLIAGCGFLGLEVARQARAGGFEVFGLRRNPPAGPAPLEWIQGDARALDPERLPKDLGAVVYLVSADGQSEPGYQSAYVDGLRALLLTLIARQGHAPRTLFVSSTRVWGESDGAWVDEHSPARPADPLGALLLEGEAVRRSLASEGASLRAGGLYGPGRTTALERARRGLPLAAGSAGRFTNRIHVFDAAAAVLFLLRAEHLEDPYALVDLEPASEAQFAAFLARGLGLAGPTEAADGDPGPRGRSGNKRVRPSRLIELGFSWRYPTFREGYGELLAGSGVEDLNR